jgi:hypothetical protein
MTVPESNDDASEFQSLCNSEPFLRKPPPDLDPGLDASMVDDTGSDSTSVIANMGGFGTVLMGRRRGFCGLSPKSTTTEGRVVASLALFSASEGSLDAAASSSVHFTEKVRVMRTVRRGPSERGVSSMAVPWRGTSMCVSEAVKEDDRPLGLRTVEVELLDCALANWLPKLSLHIVESYGLASRCTILILLLMPRYVVCTFSNMQFKAVFTISSVSLYLVAGTGSVSPEPGKDDRRKRERCGVEVADVGLDRLGVSRPVLSGIGAICGSFPYCLGGPEAVRVWFDSASPLLLVRICLGFGGSVAGLYFESNSSSGCRADVSPCAMSTRTSLAASRSRSVGKWQSGGSDTLVAGDSASTSRMNERSGNSRPLVWASSICELTS